MLLGIAIVVVSLVFAWRFADTPKQPDAVSSAQPELEADELGTDEDEPAGLASIPRLQQRVNAGTTQGAADAPLPPLMIEDLPPRDVVAQLLPLVEQGRVDAMHALAMTMVGCHRARMIRDDDQIQNMLVRRFRWRNGREPGTDEELDSIARDLDRMSVERERCAGIDDSTYLTRLELLEKAALAGNTDAMLDYADWGLQDMDGYNTLLLRFDEVARRRELAARFLNNALVLGDCRALPVLAEAYSGSVPRRAWIVSADPYMAAVYTQAQAQAPATLSDPGHVQSWSNLFDVRSEPLDPARRDAARAQAAQIVQRHCSGLS